TVAAAPAPPPLLAPPPPLPAAAIVSFVSSAHAALTTASMTKPTRDTLDNHDCVILGFIIVLYGSV
ncbi:MAG: hypothetical protein RL701_7854, partial [Pseudomonadota bacterium]